MPSAKKPVETKTATEVVKEPEVVAEVKKPVSRAKSVKVQPEPVVEVKKEEVSSAVIDTTTPATEEKESENLVQVLVDKISSLTTLNKEIQVVLKQVARDYDKLKKIVDKIQKKRENARKSPSGFAKPNKISDELCDFIGVPRGTEKSRTDITRYINTYVKEHNLNKPTNRRVILPDEKLKAILNVKEGEEVTFFILQRLISHHFPPKNVK
jgi:chromatin remodeling complex protein RSC6